jgi:hypothetical protein
VSLWQQPVRLAYQPPASSTFLSEQTSHHQPANSTLLSEQTSTSHQPPANRTGMAAKARFFSAKQLSSNSNLAPLFPFLYMLAETNVYPINTHNPFHDPYTLFFGNVPNLVKSTTAVQIAGIDASSMKGPAPKTLCSSLFLVTFCEL